MEKINNILKYEILNIGDYIIRISGVVNVIVIILITWIALWLIKKALFRKHDSTRLDEGNMYALYQLIKYVILVIAIGLILNAIGISITVLIASSAALLVGVGLGLQQTFNDVVSGIILLSERSIKVGDILEVDDDVIKLQEIGLRTSKGLNRDEISIILPNSLITTNKVINWSHQTKKTRFKINVGVAYGSDVDLVMNVLKESVLEHKAVTDNTLVDIWFLDFGNSSLDFQVLFYSENIFRIEKVKSEIRRIINRKFIENGITIPFPQVDLHVRSKDL